ncbi:MAG: phage terminase large subunit family protein [Pseudomonadales bacterium]
MDLVRPPPKRTPWEWAEAKRRLPKEAAEPGPYRSSRTPWIRGISRAIAIPGLRSVVAVMGSQLGKTDGCCLNVIGWQFDDDPRPVLYIGPTEKNAVSVSRDRLGKMIRAVPSLYDGLAKGQQDRDVEKFIHGVRLGIGWASSATELASHPAAKVFIDERDRMDDVRGEGDPNTLAEARVATYDGIVVTLSTPTRGIVETEEVGGLERWKPAPAEDLQSPSWKLWQEGSRHEYAVPCPECREYFIPRFKLLSWPKDSTPAEAFEAAAMACPACGSLIADSHREWMADHGVFIAPQQRPQALQDGDTAARVVEGTRAVDVPYGDFLEPQHSGSLTFWVSGLCSKWRTFGHRASNFLKAMEASDPGRVQAEMNTGFGELYRPRVNVPDWQVVANLREPYKQDDVPEWVQALTCGVDVGGRVIHFSVYGWGPSMACALIRHGEIHGETKFEAPWRKLDELLEYRWGDLSIRWMMVDSGFNPSKSLSGSVDDEHVPANMVYDFCRRHRGRVFAAKGWPTRAKPISTSMIDVNVNGRKVPNGLQLVNFDTDFFKCWIYDRLEMEPDDPGRMRLPEDATDDYCRHMTSEARTVKPSGKVEWLKLRENHYFDAAVLNAVVAHMQNLNMLTEATWKSYRGGQDRSTTLADIAEQLNG